MLCSPVSGLRWVFRCRPDGLSLLGGYAGLYLALVDAGLELLEEQTGDTEETGDQTTLKEGQ